MARIFALAFILLMIIHAKALASEIVELDGGACWAKPENFNGQTVWKIASFNDGKNFIYPLNNQLENAITDTLKNIFPSFPATKYRVDLHCGGAGSLILASFFEGDTPLCVWAKRTENSNVEFSVLQVLPNPNTAPDSACLGVTPGKLLMAVKDDVDHTAVETYLKKRFRNLIDTVRYYDISKIFSIDLKQTYHFHEAEARSRLQKNPYLRKRIRFVEYDGAVVISGENLLMRSGDYPGY